MSATHEVTNQVPPLVGHDPIAGDAALAEAVPAGTPTRRRSPRSPSSAGWPAASRRRSGARLANENPPKLRTHDRYGHRVDEVEFHPAWHELMGRRSSTGWPARPGPAAAGDPHAHVRRAVGYVGWTQVEMGHGCPVTMTYAAVPALRRDPELAARYEPGLTAPRLPSSGSTEPAGQAGPDRRHGHDREAGRLRRAGQHHARRRPARRHATR